MWSRSVVARLMLPVAVMLVLVSLLGAVGISSRARLRAAYETLEMNQRVRADLVEVRSLSRSLQRDVLNLAIEPDRREVAVLGAKFAGRLAAMRGRLDALRRDGLEQKDARGGDYFETQRRVLERLVNAAQAAGTGARGRSLAIFRSEVRPNERAASRIADQLISERERFVDDLAARAHALERQEFTIRIAASVLLFLLAAGTTLFVILRTVVRPMADIERALGRVAAGDTAGETPHTARPDEIGAMARAVEVFRAGTLERERFRMQAEQARTAEMRRELEREQAQRRAEQADAARNQQVAAAVAALEAEVEQVLQRLRGSAGELSAAASALSGHSSTSARDIGDVRAAAARAADGASDIAAATTQFMATLHDASAKTRRSAGLSDDLARRVEELTGRMTRVQNDARTVGAVVDLIHTIARRTNLLALNASIEAARVGDAGRGFAVVAGEVKALAEQTARATDDISQQIADMQIAAAQAGESLQVIEHGIEEMARASGELASGVGEQAESGRVIGRNVEGAASDLDMIGRRLADLSVAATGVDGLAVRVRSDAHLVEESATVLNDALLTFFKGLHATPNPPVPA